MLQCQCVLDCSTCWRNPIASGMGCNGSCLQLPSHLQGCLERVANRPPADVLAQNQPQQGAGFVRMQGRTLHSSHIYVMYELLSPWQYATAEGEVELLSQFVPSATAPCETCRSNQQTV